VLTNDRPSPATGKSNSQVASAATARQGAFESPQVIAWLDDPAVSESSGVVASRRNPGLLWTHNDSGDGPFLYATDEQGKRRGVWRVAGADALDWEDIAAGPGPQPGRSYLYVGDIGDNREARREIIIYRVPEPEVVSLAASANKKSPQLTESTEAIRLQYPDGPHDAEALLIHPVTGNIYIITKTLGTAANVYQLATPYSSSALNRLKLLGQVSGVPTGLITGGDVSPDGNGIVLCDYLGAYELRLPGSTSRFDDIWRQAPANINLGVRRQGESICYAADSGSFYATSEKRPTPLIKVKRINRPG
jgi:hypothetical protein